MSKYVVAYLEVGFGVPDRIHVVIVSAKDRPTVDAHLKDIILSQGIDELTASNIIRYGAFEIKDCNMVECEL